ncbi:MAG: hypothetical protein E7588_05270 [Ruminococcaceae bacterium]|nr:hypothetical protein [Oscillospiraceae bacterium]
MKVYVTQKPLYNALCTRNICAVTKMCGDTDIAALSANNCVLPYDAEVLLVDSSHIPNITGNGRCKHIISCGMGEKDTLTFSAIGFDRSVLCVQRDIKMSNITLECGEFPVSYDERLSVWQNLVLGFCEAVKPYFEGK